MVSSGLLVTAVQDKMNQVQKDISALKNVEINSVLDDSRLIVVVNTGSMEENKTVLKKIEIIEGVRSVNVAYDHFETGDTDGRDAG
jgi:nitrate reductase NapAB chaperone NapD